MTKYEPMVGDVVLVGRTANIGRVVDNTYDGGHQWVDVQYADPLMTTAESVSDLKPRRPRVGDVVRILPPASLTPSILWTVDEVSPGSATCIVKPSVSTLMDRRVRTDLLVPVDLSVLLEPEPEPGPEHRRGDVVWVTATHGREAVVTAEAVGSDPTIAVRFTDGEDPKYGEVRVKDVDKRVLKVGDTVRPRVGTSESSRYIVTGRRGKDLEIKTLPGRSLLGWFYQADFVRVDPGPTAPPEPDDGFPRWPDGGLIKPGDVVHTARREGTVIESRAHLDDRPQVQVKWGNGGHNWPSLDVLRRGPLPPEDIEVSFSVPVELLTNVARRYKNAFDPDSPRNGAVRLMLDSLSADDAKRVGWPTW